MKIKVTKLKCKRCGWEWIPRGEDIRMCPKCKSVRWDMPGPKIKKRKEKS